MSHLIRGVISVVHNTTDQIGVRYSVIYDWPTWKPRCNKKLGETLRWWHSKINPQIPDKVEKPRPAVQVV